MNSNSTCREQSVAIICANKSFNERVETIWTYLFFLSKLMVK